MMNHRRKNTVAGATLLALSAVAAPLALAEDAVVAIPRLQEQVDFLGAANLPGHDGIAVAGHFGMVGLLKLEGGTYKLHRIPDPPKADFTALTAFSDTEALVGSQTGEIYSYDGTTLTKLAKLTEYDEPILHIAARDGKAWAVGGRGMVAKSADGKTWEAVEINAVIQPPTVWDRGDAESWYFGVSNLDPDSIKFTANVGGVPATDDHYELFAEEGYLQNSDVFDMDPAPQIEFKFNPGPPFRGGDVTWNVVLLDGDSVLIAGEFGLVLQSEDGGATWVRRDTQLVDHEPDFAYWTAGVQDGDTIILTGAAGVTSKSTDRGVTWSIQPRPGNEGIFGITFVDGDPLVAGAVGLIGRFDGNEWALADRTSLKLLSWLKNPVPLDDGSVLMLGGRSTAILYKDKTWTRVPLDTE